jgi:hypothetical protein
LLRLDVFAEEILAVPVLPVKPEEIVYNGEPKLRVELVPVPLGKPWANGFA